VAVKLGVAVVVAVGETLAAGVGVAVALDTVALAIGVTLVAGLGVVVFSAVAVTLDEVELATTILDDGVALDVVAADAIADVDAGVGVEEADTLAAAVTATI